MGDAQAVEGPVAAHETHLGAGHIGGQRQRLDQLQIEAGGLETGAAHRHQMGDRSRIDGGSVQGRAAGPQGQGTGLGGETGHALGGAGVGACVKGQAIRQRALGVRQQHAVAEGHAGTALQTPQQGGLDVIGGREALGHGGRFGLAEAMGWQGGADPQQVHGHGVDSGAWAGPGRADPGRADPGRAGRCRAASIGSARLGQRRTASKTNRLLQGRRNTRARA